MALIPYLLIWGPADLLGMQATFEDGKMTVRSIEADSLLGRAGIRAGDQVTVIDDRPIRSTQDWNVTNANLQVDLAQHWKILRNGQTIEIEIIPERATWKNRLFAGYISYSALTICSFMVGLFIAFRKPHDPTARMGAWFIGTASIVFGLPNGWAVVWREVPLLFQALFWIPTLCRFVMEAIFLSLLIIFPRKLTNARWPWVLIWIPVLTTLPWRISQFAATIYSPSEALGIPSWIFQAALMRTMLYLIAGIVILLITYRRFLGPDEKRRVRVLLAGTAISLASSIATVWKLHRVGFGLTNSTLWILLIHPLTLAAPLAFAYAIVRHRVFDIRVIIRQGLQYALARGAVLGLVPAMGAILVLDLALNSHQPLAEILQSRGWVYLAISVVAVLLYTKRNKWLEAIDRRFFREQYDAQRLLRDVVQEVRTASSVEHVAQSVASRIEAALHPEFVSLMVREPYEPKFRPLASAPPDQAPLSLSADSKLVGLASVLGKPLEVLLGDSDWLDQRLPWEEIDLVRRTRIDLLIPITSSTEGRQALLVLGIRRSEEPFTPRDQELLEAIAGNLALLLEHPAAATPSGGSDPKTDLRTQGLTAESMTGKVFSQYKVLGQLGRGGMGEVYLAEDTTLGRNVALKFMPKHLHEEELAQKRFLREAKSAAALDHPFICKIYEIGQTEVGHSYIAMEYVEGQTLKEKLIEGSLTLEQSLQIAAQVANALEIAHKKNIIHRDLKPANIMLTEQAHTKVMDFGLAKRLTSDDSSDQDLTSKLTKEGATIGTPAYMSPEQIKAERADHRSDIFSLGIVLYEMLTGVHPFRRVRAFETMGAILYDEPQPISEYLPEANADLQEILARMLTKDPSDRLASASELAESLQRVALL
jgi:tRNA A-37 threonylcarbamoyl transferase component Bud32